MYMYKVLRSGHVRFPELVSCELVCEISVCQVLIHKSPSSVNPHTVGPHSDPVSSVAVSRARKLVQGYPEKH